MKNRSVGIYYWFGYPVEPKLRLRLIREAGFKGMSFLHYTGRLENDTVKGAYA
jgi:hypothetical protein